MFVTDDHVRHVLARADDADAHQGPAFRLGARSLIGSISARWFGRSGRDGREVGIIRMRSAGGTRSENQRTVLVSLRVQPAPHISRLTAAAARHGRQVPQQSGDRAGGRVGEVSVRRRKVERGDQRAGAEEFSKCRVFASRNCESAEELGRVGGRGGGTCPRASGRRWPREAVRAREALHEQRGLGGGQRVGVWGVGRAGAACPTAAFAGRWRNLKRAEPVVHLERRGREFGQLGLRTTRRPRA